MVITKLKQVETLANTLFKCALKPIRDEVHAKGYIGFRLIVGFKRNHAYDASVDINNPDPKYLNNEDLLRNITNPMMPDVRTIWMKPGTTEQDLLDNELSRIKKDLEQVKPQVVKKDNTLTKVNEESDSDLAAKVAAGEDVDSRFEDFDEGYDDDDVNISKEELDNAGPEEKEEVEKDESNKGEVMEALGMIAQNIEVLNSNVDAVNESVDKIEGRLTKVEKVAKKSPGRPKANKNK